MRVGGRQNQFPTEPAGEEPDGADHERAQTEDPLHLSGRAVLPADVAADDDVGGKGGHGEHRGQNAEQIVASLRIRFEDGACGRNAGAQNAEQDSDRFFPGDLFAEEDRLQKEDDHGRKGQNQREIDGRRVLQAQGRQVLRKDEAEKSAQKDHDEVPALDSLPLREALRDPEKEGVAGRADADVAERAQVVDKEVARRLCKPTAAHGAG